MDAVIVIGLFFAAGFGLDRLLGTQPVFMIALTILGSIGLFMTFRYRYEARMQELEAERLARRADAQAGPDPVRTNRAT
jgi:F0F1-type ATP synthase assembly protein I